MVDVFPSTSRPGTGSSSAAASRRSLPRPFCLRSDPSGHCVSAAVMAQKKFFFSWGSTTTRRVANLIREGPNSLKTYSQLQTGGQFGMQDPARRALRRLVAEGAIQASIEPAPDSTRARRASAALISSQR